MQRFDFFSPRSMEEALHCLAEKKERCKIIAGGTDLIPVLRQEDIDPEIILGILEIEELRGIREEDRSIRIGSTTSFTEMEESDLLKSHFPCLVQAAASVGGPQIRNRGTIGGNIANASPAADVLPAVLALDGELELRSRGSGVRRMPLAKAIASPYVTHFQSDEILAGIVIRKCEKGTRGLFEKLGRRNAMARARMNLSILLRLDREERIEEIRIAAGAVMPVARRMGDAEKILQGQKPEPSLIESSVEAMAEEMLRLSGVRWSSGYKAPVLKNIARRLLKQLIEE